MSVRARSEPFQLFPALDAATEAALRFSIERFGVLVPVAKDQNGRVLDGYHRSRIAAELGVTFRVDVISVADDEEAREIARTLNADRRQLDPEQRRQVEAAMREAGHSLRAIGGALGVDEKTVRNDLSGADLSAPDRVAGKDGKSYPARRTTIVPAKNERDRLTEAESRRLVELEDTIATGLAWPRVIFGVPAGEQPGPFAAAFWAHLGNRPADAAALVEWDLVAAYLARQALVESGSDVEDVIARSRIAEQAARERVTELVERETP